eukprot:COSAG06_NODE_1275_length_10046_cov_4.285915_7_plen_86_part_00
MLQLRAGQRAQGGELLVRHPAGVAGAVLVQQRAARCGRAPVDRSVNKCFRKYEQVAFFKSWIHNLRKPPFSLSFPYVCPEPVLLK